MISILQDNAFIRAAIKIVSSAVKEILISTFKLEYPVTKCPPLRLFFDTLVDKSTHGCHVNFIFNWHPNLCGVPRSNFPTAKFLKEKGINMRYLDNSRCCHSKIILVDSAHLLVGSHNLSVASTRSNFDLSIITDTNPAVLDAHARFYELFSKAKKF